VFIFFCKPFAECCQFNSVKSVKGFDVLSPSFLFLSHESDKAAIYWSGLSLALLYLQVFGNVSPT